MHGPYQARCRQAYDASIYRVRLIFVDPYKRDLEFVTALTEGKLVLQATVKAHIVILLYPGEKGLEYGKWSTSIDIYLIGNKFGCCLIIKISIFTIVLMKARSYRLG